MSSQSALNPRYKLEDVILDTTKRLDKFIVDSSNNTVIAARKLKHIEEVLNNISLKVLKIAQAPTSDNMSPQTIESPTNQFNEGTPTPLSSDEIEQSVRRSLNTWVPPETSEQQETKKNTKSILKKLFTSDKSEKDDVYSTRGRRSMYTVDQYTPLLGKMVNGITTSLAKSVFAKSPVAKILKFILSPQGLVVIYLIGKLLKKYVIDPVWDSVVKFIDPIENVLNKVLEFLPSFDSIKKAASELSEIFFDKNATFTDKLIKALNLNSILFSPITDFFAYIQGTLLIMLAGAADKFKLRGPAVSMLQAEQEIYERMNVEHWKKKLKAEERSSGLVVQYAEVFDKDKEIDLVNKIREGVELSGEQQAIAESANFKNRFNNVSLQSISERNRSYYEELKQYEKNVGINLSRIRKLNSTDFSADAISPDQRATLMMEHSGKEAKSKLTAELKNMKFGTEQEILSYLTQLLIKHENLTRSSSAQEEALKEVANVLIEQDKMTDSIRTKLDNVSSKFKQQTFIAPTTKIESINLTTSNIGYSPMGR